jgi:hypothetical protein
LGWRFSGNFATNPVVVKSILQGDEEIMPIYNELVSSKIDRQLE